MIVRSGSEMQSACSIKVIDKERIFNERVYTRMAYLNTYVAEKRVSDT